ncbi:MAG: ATP-binding protein [Candidatus Cloacimonetes bacterium]|nr:ATP-binding protein [Candidatus Cloacimonadota bacterium]
MRISSRLLILFVVIAIVFVAFFYLFYHIKREEMRLYQESDHNQRKYTLDTILVIKADEQKLMGESFSISDALYNYMYDRDPQWAKNNLEPVNTVFGYPLLQLYDAQGQKIYSNTMETNPGFAEYTLESTITDTLSKGGVIGFYDIFHQYTLYCTVASIHPGYDPLRESKPAGYFLIAKVFDYPYLRDLSSELNYDISISRQNPGDESMGEGYDTRINKALKNYNNDTVAWLSFDSSNPFLQRLRSLGNLILFGTIGFIFVFLLMQFFLIQQWISQPMSLISQSLKDNDPSSIHELSNKNNEFADVANLIERFFAQKEELIKEIEERARTEALLREVEEQTRKIIFTIPESVVVTDLDGHILSVNDESLKIYKFDSEAEIIKRSLKLEDLVISSDRQHLKRMFQDLYKGIYVKNQELCFRDSMGESIPCLLSASVILNDDNKPGKLVFVTRDLTDIKSLETQLRQSQKMESIGTMAGGIAHDFNNIITIIAGYIALSTGKIETCVEAQNDLDEALKACLRAKSLIGKILTFTRKGEPDVGEVVLADIIDDSLPMIRAIIPVKVSIDTDIRSRSFARVDETEMQQVLLNLATNAVHAMQPDGGSLFISLEEISGFEILGIDPKVQIESPYLHLEVRDTGSGIAPELISRIFDPYFSTKASSEGTGLGLSIVHGIVSGYRGFINVHSIVGEGSSFHIYLPAIDAAKVKKKIRSTKDYPFIPARVLIVDDEPSLIDIFSQSLQAAGYETQSFTDSRLALQAYISAETPFDLIIADINMPGMDGIKLATEALALRKVPVILYTGFLDPAQQHKIEALKHKIILNKPIMPDEMIKSVRRSMHEFYTGKDMADGRKVDK